MRWALFVLIICSACSTKVPAPEEIPAEFPHVAGESLNQSTIKLPSAYLGKPVVYLIGYKQNAQFDIDRWILGLLQLNTPVKIVELPTIQGMPASMVSNFITSGMRRGIPEADWSTVITLFDEDADRIATEFGNERPQSAYVVLVDSKGLIQWFYNDGYSATSVQQLDSEVRNL